MFVFVESTFKMEVCFWRSAPFYSKFIDIQDEIVVGIIWG